MGKHKTEETKSITFDESLIYSPTGTSRQSESLKIHRRKGHNDFELTSLNNHKVNLLYDKSNHRDETVILNGLTKGKKRKQKHTFSSDVQNDVSCYQNISESTESKPHVKGQNVPELPSKKIKLDSTSNQNDLSDNAVSNEIITHKIKTNNKKVPSKHKKWKRKNHSVLNGNPENASSFQEIREKCNEMGSGKHDGVDKSVRKKRRQEPVSRLQSQDDSFYQSASNIPNELKLQGDATVSYSSSIPKMCEQSGAQEIKKGKWYREHELSDDEKDFTSDESTNEMDYLQSRRLQRQHRRLSNERLSRTLFVGNLPMNISKKRIETLFNNVLRNGKISSSDCCVESIRFRGIVPVTGGTSKLARKRAAITGEFSGISKFRMGYVVLTTKVGVPIALSLNGCCLNSDGFVVNSEELMSDMGHGTIESNNNVKNNNVYHIRVDRVTDNKTHKSSNNCVFLGNLPFDCTEEEVHSILSTLGLITNVRLVRDSQTGAVRGFGYATFSDSSIIPLAIRSSNSLSIRGRQIRIMEYKLKQPTSVTNHQELKSVKTTKNNAMLNIDLKRKAKKEKRKKRRMQQQQTNLLKRDDYNTHDGGDGKKLRKDETFSAKNKAKGKKSRETLDSSVQTNKI